MNSPAICVSAVGKTPAASCSPATDRAPGGGLTLIDAHLREPTVATEIAECVWVDPCHPTKPLVPLLEQALFPALLP
ncbi:hypothetical protein [Corynebacterium diphtheriae]|uniref:hypothetical protein n=1 Tax=Corynebacterium diphtheriae TaxID=1717 RepID=UPI0008FB683F|nr:hypothetical protein [Corynebacterium diphtheriae]APM36375.1 hypothetical protein BS112_07735 [Corynebacterium diphtheriae]MBG9222019.1 hypothetical protein [Corynebacterium diphtheriae bv. mitis]MBG9276785.1 hypothetical protein [Corynebacterium diphtheriae bv. mitis]MBG9281134.1 hypothetical protein [Corynebacterium diphtheriae bv. mitis]MBG9294190.1 hypothetical protein [Corynebacterium diphtheriae bv. mitis]